MQRFKNILCVIVSSSNGRDAWERAVELAGNNQARLTVIEVIDEIPTNINLQAAALSPEELQAIIVAEHREELQKLVCSCDRNIEIQTDVLIGIPFLEIIREVLRNRRDLVIKTLESDELLDRIFASDDMHLLRKCPCPVWLVKPKSPKTYRRILAAVDIDDFHTSKELDTIIHPLNRQILKMASSLALSEFAELHIVHAWEAIGEGLMRGAFVQCPEHEIVSYVEEVRQKNNRNLSVLMDEVISELGSDALEYLKPEVHLPKGFPRNEVPALAEELEVDLVVMGTVARTGISGLFMGNTAESILNRLDCSVLAIKPVGFVTPVTLNDQ